MDIFPPKHERLRKKTAGTPSLCPPSIFPEFYFDPLVTAPLHPATENR